MTRDHVIADWRFSEESLITEGEFGSGYPSGRVDQLMVLLMLCVKIDPVTKEWLASNKDPVFGFPSVVRFSWSTAANILSDAVPVKWLVQYHASIDLFANH